jgi:hypothetical protein
MDDLKKIGCDNCGGELIFSPGTQLSTCNFCGSEFNIQNATDVEVEKVDTILPFNTSSDQFEIAALKWLSDGDFTPDDILEGSLFNNQVGMYLPMWFFSGKYDGNWSASSGYDREEEYWGKSYDGKRVLKTRTVTDWRPSSGRCNGDFTFLATASRDSSVPSSVKDFSHDVEFGRGEMKDFKAEYTQGFSLLKLELSSQEAWSIHGKSQASSYVRSKSRDRVPGDHFKDFYVDAVYDIKGKTSCYVPFWLRNYNYKDSGYHLYMDGTNVSRIDGVRPVDKERESVVEKLTKTKNFGCGGIILFGFLLFSILLSNFQDYNGNITEVEFNFLMVLLFGSIALGGILYYFKNNESKTIISDSKKVRQDKLAARIKSLGPIKGGGGNNKYSNLSKEQMLEVCKLINPHTQWEFHQILDNDGIGTDDMYEFLAHDESIIQINIHQPSNNAILCYLHGDVDNEGMPSDKIQLVDNYLKTIDKSSKTTENFTSKPKPSF